MDFFFTLAGEQRASSALVRSIPIGIFGSFAPRNLPLLETLRNRLVHDGYAARISLDLSTEHPCGENESPDTYNLRISHLLLDRSRIHLFVFFVEVGSEHCINQSASMEFERLCEQKRTQNMLILIEEGVFEQAGGYFRGRWAQTSSGILWEPFTRTEENLFAKATDVETLIRQFCLQKILSWAEDPASRDRYRRS